MTQCSVNLQKGDGKEQRISKRFELKSENFIGNIGSWFYEWVKSLKLL